METLQQNPADALQILIYVSIVLILIVGVFLIKLLLDTSYLVKSLQDLVKVTQAEIEPAMEEINGTLANIKNISSSVNNQFNAVNNGLEKGSQIVSESADKIYRKLKTAGMYTKEGLLVAINTFLKK